MCINKGAVIEQRQTHRVRFGEPVSFVSNDGGISGGCLAHDLSESGIRINLQDFIPVQTEMNLRMRIGSGPLIDVTGRVAWLQEIPFSERYYVGVKFTRSNTTSQEEIRSYVNSHRS